MFVSVLFVFPRITNGGKSTLSQSLHQQIPNSCVVAQDSYFKVNFTVNAVGLLLGFFLHFCLGKKKLGNLLYPPG